MTSNPKLPISWGSSSSKNTGNRDLKYRKKTFQKQKLIYLLKKFGKDFITIAELMGGDFDEFKCRIWSGNLHLALRDG